jgi:N-acetylmuramic acid 6-phosphate etherase
MENKINLEGLMTEGRNPDTIDIDRVSTLEIVEKINNEDAKIAAAVKKVLPQVAKAVDIIANAFNAGGRLFYIGAGTSGRLGILDASECPPTYGVSPEQVQGLIAGGVPAIFSAQEGAEDSLTLAQEQLEEKKLNKHDVVAGLAASGRTPYVIAGLKYARQIGCKTIAIACTANSQISKESDCAIEVLVGPEALTGSTRMKAGTAQKMVLNMLTTSAMIKTGKVYSNLMIDVQATNKKLVERSKRIVMQATNCDYQTAQTAIEKSAGSVKTAVVMILVGIDTAQAKKLLDDNKGFVAKILELRNA